MKKMARALLAASAAALTLPAFTAADARPGGGGRVATERGIGGGHARGGHPGRDHGGRFRGAHGGHSRDHWRSPWRHRGHWHPGPFWGGFGFGVGLGAIVTPGFAYAPYAAPYDAYGYYDWDDAYGWSYDASPGRFATVPRVGRPVPPVARAPDPIFYPNAGQSSATLEADRRECNRWATTQPGAMAEASIFQRATLACMEGRGYTVR